MEDVGIDDITGSGPDSRGPIREASITTDAEDDNLIYDQEHFRKNKAWHHYDFYYQDRMVIAEQGVVMSDFDDRAPRVRAILDA